MIAAILSPQLTAEPPNTLLRIERDPHAGRRYHATVALPPGATILDASTPYTYAIWKQFRNEVCAECWRYEGGRTAFLTRRDEHGYSGPTDRAEDGLAAADARSGTGAGLWFCDARCQASWIAREGIDTLQLLRRLEGARSKKEKDKASDSTSDDDAAAAELTQDDVQRAWDEVGAKESSPKEVRRWRQIQLDDYETDMARYVLLALAHLRREREARADALRVPSTETNGDLGFGGAGWAAFAALQPNELHQIRAYPEILSNQIRVYQALRARFGVGSASIRRTQSQSGPQGARKLDKDASSAQGRGGDGEPAGLDAVITVANVRTALSVDPGNSFGIWELPLTEESECVGFAVYPRQSLFNHHCSPNVSKERNGRALRFITTRAVDAGEELCIGYGHAEGMGVKERREELLEGWFFECRCSRCLAEIGAA